MKETEKVEWKKEWVQEEIELLSNQEYHKARVYLAKKQGFARETIADYEMEPHKLARLIVSKKLKTLRKRIRALQFIDIKEIYKQLFIEPEQIKQWRW
ncbi:Helicase OS=Lysinibacillus sphaericus OX=1421 GN=LS41612_00580 PE=4 SV=1 [Lysinibacillus sphaericus]